MAYCYEMSQSVEIVSNLRPRKILAEGSTQGLSTLIFGRTFSLFTNWMSSNFSAWSKTRTRTPSA
jgi:hypothetical protein